MPRPCTKRSWHGSGRTMNASRPWKAVASNRCTLSCNPREARASSVLLEHRGDAEDEIWKELRADVGAGIQQLDIPSTSDMGRQLRYSFEPDNRESNEKGTSRTMLT